MRRTRMLSFFLLLALIGWFLWWMSSLVQGAKGGLLDIMTKPGTLTSGPDMWVFFGRALLYFWVAGWDSRARQRKHTYGSAGYATRHEARAFSLSAQAFRRVLHVVAAILRGARGRQKQALPTSS